MNNMGTGLTSTMKASHNYKIKADDVDERKSRTNEGRRIKEGGKKEDELCVWRGPETGSFLKMSANQICLQSAGFFRIFSQV